MSRSRTSSSQLSSDLPRGRARARAPTDDRTRGSHPPRPPRTPAVPINFVLHPLVRATWDSVVTDLAFTYQARVQAHETRTKWVRKLRRRGVLPDHMRAHAGAGAHQTRTEAAADARCFAQLLQAWEDGAARSQKLLDEYPAMAHARIAEYLGTAMARASARETPTWWGAASRARRCAFLDAYVSQASEEMYAAVLAKVEEWRAAAARGCPPPKPVRGRERRSRRRRLPPVTAPLQAGN